MHELPSTSEDNGRDNRGRFAAGNKAARGNPYGRRAARLRAELFRECSPADFKAIVRALIAKAKDGDLAAIREALDRLIGKPTEGADILARIDALEAHGLDDEEEGLTT